MSDVIESKTESPIELTEEQKQKILDAFFDNK